MKIRQLLTSLILALLCVAAISNAAQDNKIKNPHARWEPAIRDFEATDRKTPQPRNGVLFVGSSSIRFWDLKKSFPNLPTINHGFGGSEIADAIHFADRIVWPFTPRVIVFYAGDNDIAGGNSAEQTMEDFKTFSQQVHENLPNTQLIYVAIKPSIRRWSMADEMKKANAAIAEECSNDDKRIFLDIWTPMLGDSGQPKPGLFIKDGLHLNDVGYKLWSGLVKVELEKLSDSGPN